MSTFPAPRLRRFFWLYKARALAVAETNDEALVAFQSALNLNPESRKITLEMSDHLVRMEAYDDAEQLLTGYAALKPNDATALMALARIYEAAGDPEKAEDTLLQLMSVSDESDAETIQQLVAVQVSLENYADALENADNLLEQDPANIPVRELRVTALVALDREDEAQEERDRIRRLTPVREENNGESTELASVAP